MHCCSVQSFAARFPRVGCLINSRLRSYILSAEIKQLATKALVFACKVARFKVFVLTGERFFECARLQSYCEEKKMTNLTVWKFDTVDGAEKALSKLIELQKQNLIEVIDAATVTWPTGRKKPTTRQLVPTTAISSLDGAFWGMLLWIPFLYAVRWRSDGIGSRSSSGTFRGLWNK